MGQEFAEANCAAAIDLCNLLLGLGIAFGIEQAITLSFTARSQTAPTNTDRHHKQNR